MACHDRYDHSLSTTSDLSAERYRTGIDLLLSLWPSTAETLDEAITADPDFALAHAARARFHAIRAEVTQARVKIATASEIVNRSGSERELSHVAVLSLAINGESPKALAVAITHTDQWPRDILILSLLLGAFGLLAFSGRADHDQARVDLCERHAKHFDADDWRFLTYRGWAHGENGSISLGRTLTERAFELRRHNVNAVHALAHVMYEAGEGIEAQMLIDSWLPEYDRSGVLHNHIAWHAAFIALERGDTKRTLDIYHANVAPRVATGVPINVVSDTSSFLWRMQAYGYVVPDGLWEAAGNYASNYFQQARFPFADFHMAIVAAATGDHKALDQRIKSLVTMLEGGKLPAGPVVPALCRAVSAYAHKNYGLCTEILEPIAHEAVRIGGSGAQREIVEDTLLVSLMRCGRVDKAPALLKLRLHRRPSPRDARWLSEIAVA